MKKLFSLILFSIVLAASSSSFAQIANIRDCDRYVGGGDRINCLHMYSTSVENLVIRQLEEIILKPDVYGEELSSKTRKEANQDLVAIRKACDSDSECLYSEYVDMYRRYVPVVQKARRDTHERLAKQRSARALQSIPEASSDNEVGE